MSGWENEYTYVCLYDLKPGDKVLKSATNGVGHGIVRSVSVDRSGSMVRSVWIEWEVGSPELWHDSSLVAPVYVGADYEEPQTLAVLCD